MELWVDGREVSVPEGATVLEACDQAGRYVPRLCSYPGLGCFCSRYQASVDGEAAISLPAPRPCGLCAVRVDGGDQGDAVVLACSTTVQPGMEVVTDDPSLHAERLERLAEFLAHHPHVCLSCPDRDGCTQEECAFGIRVEARCCDEFGRCEFGKLVGYVDSCEDLPRRAVTACRDATTEGRIRREPGLCLGCGRCVAVCGSSPAAGNALRLVRVDRPGWARPGDESASDLWGGAPLLAAHEGSWTAVPKNDTLRASGCTFCGQCVMVCPTGAVTAPGEEGARWLDGWRKRTRLPDAVLPPEVWRPLAGGGMATIPSVPGVFLLADEAGRVLRIAGVADLARGVALALAEGTSAAVTSFRVEPAELFTQRESELLARFVQQHRQLPPGNDLADDLFADDLFSDGVE